MTTPFSTKPEPEHSTKTDGQKIYLQHPTLPLQIVYWRGRVAELLVERLGYIEITQAEYESEEVCP